MKTSPFKELGKGTLWVLKEFGKVSVRDISYLIGWKSKSVRDELRRIVENTYLGHWVHKEKDNQGHVTFIMDEIARKSSLDFLCDLGRCSYKFNTLVLQK